MSRGVDQCLWRLHTCRAITSDKRLLPPLPMDKDILWSFRVTKLEQWLLALESQIDKMDHHRFRNDWLDLNSLKWELEAVRGYALKKQRDQATAYPTAVDLEEYNATVFVQSQS